MNKSIITSSSTTTLSSRNKRLISPRNALDVAIWVRLNGLIPLPGMPGEKKPMAFIWGDKKNDPADSYHKPTSARIGKIRNFFRNLPKSVNEDLISLALDAEYGELLNSDENSNFQLSENIFPASLDLDTDKYYDLFINHPLLQNWPVVRGKKGAKAFCKVDYTGYDKPKDTAFEDPENHTDALEVLTRLRLMFIYGEHPDSTRRNTIRYRFIRGFDMVVFPCEGGNREDYYKLVDCGRIPTLSYMEFLRVQNQIASDLGLVPKARGVKEQRSLSPTQIPRRKVCGEPRGNSRSLGERLELKVEDIGMPVNPTVSGEEIIGSHPFHGSTTGQNYHINPSKGVWRCYHASHQSGGDALMLYAVKQGILACEDCHAGVLCDPHLMRAIVDALRRDGYPVDENAPYYEALHIVQDSITFDAEVSIWD